VCRRSALRKALAVQLFMTLMFTNGWGSGWCLTSEKSRVLLGVGLDICCVEVSCVILPCYLAFCHPLVESTKLERHRIIGDRIKDTIPFNPLKSPVVDQHRYQVDHRHGRNVCRRDHSPTAQTTFPPTPTLPKFSRFFKVFGKFYKKKIQEDREYSKHYEYRINFSNLWR
jgi:hypothetical protein